MTKYEQYICIYWKSSKSVACKEYCEYQSLELKCKISKGYEFELLLHLIRHFSFKS